jgi:hypothetical protein
MGREILLTLLITMSGGLILQVLAGWPSGGSAGEDPAALERRAWLALCRPVLPVLVIAAWLTGWWLTQPDPVRDPVNPLVIVALWLPFGLLFTRAAVRAVWALVRELPECGVSTCGFLQPQVVFSPFLARELDEPVIRAALAHERAHARHRDPLRIWLAQLITDLQWPWPQAQRRLSAWLAALELARDEEARREGVEGADLAAAVLASVRYLGALAPRQQVAFGGGTQLAHARLLGEGQSLRHRVSRLLAPLSPAPGAACAQRLGLRRLLMPMIPLLLAAVLLGVVYGQVIMRPLLALT